MTKSRMILLALLAVLVGVGIWTRGFGLLTEQDDGTLRLGGNVDVREVDLAFRVPGRIAAIPVEEGARVVAGATLATLDTATLDSRIAQADAQLGASQAELAKARAGSRPQEISQARARLAAAQAALDEAEADVRRRRPLVGPGAISRDQWDATLALRDRAAAQAREAASAVSLLEAGARSEDIRAAEAQVAQARAARDTARIDVSDTRLIAPVSGLIATRAREPGAIVQPGETIMTLAIDRPLRVRAYVAESDLSRISPGMKVTVTADGNPRAYSGSIGYISPRAEFTPKTVETEDLRTDLVYRLRIIVDNPDGNLRQGQPVTVTVSGARPRAAD